jgi:hypothetical protein
MADGYTILTLYDGSLFARCRIYDSSTILVKGVMSPEEVARLDGHLYAGYILKRGKFNAHQTALDYLAAKGYEVLPVYHPNIDFSSAREG